MEKTGNQLIIYNQDSIQKKIYAIRGVQVMFDSDLAAFYGVETRRLNEQVKRNKERFPSGFMFRLTREEYDNLMSQIAISSGRHGGRRKLPYVFTEQGVAMLAGVLKSETAVKLSIQIISAFVEMRKFLITNAGVFQRLDRLEYKQIETDQKFEEIFNALQSKDIEPKQGIFFEGQIFDAHKFISGIIRKAEKEIILIDNYIDETVLDLFAKKKKDVRVTILTKNINKALKLDENKFNSQYPAVTIKEFNKAHDRFMIIDSRDVYHFGASLKDLGKKWFAFSKFDNSAVEVLRKLNEKNYE